MLKNLEEKTFVSEKPFLKLFLDEMEGDVEYNFCKEKALSLLGISQI